MFMFLQPSYQLLCSFNQIEKYCVEQYIWGNLLRKGNSKLIQAQDHQRVVLVLCHPMFGKDLANAVPATVHDPQRPHVRIHVR